MRRSQGIGRWPWLILALACLWAGPGLSAADNIELGLDANWTWPQFDFPARHTGQAYGILFHYWLNDTTAIDSNFDLLLNSWRLTQGGAADQLKFQAWALTVGARYAPELDLFVSPYFGAGLGYQLWSSTSSVSGVEARGSNGMTYYILLGADYRISPKLAVGPMVRFSYFPLADRLEEKARSVSGRQVVDKTRLEQAGFLITGLALTVRIH